jgi:hypothetical protein
MGALRARSSDVDLILALPYGPAADDGRIRGRTHGSTRSRVAPVSNFRLHPKGRPHMPVRHAHAQPLAPRGSSPGPRHLGRRPRLIDEEQAFRLKIKLVVEPGLPPPQNVRPALLRGMRRLFLSVRPCRRKNRQRVPMPTATPCSDRSALISDSVMSGLVSTRDRMTAACASMRCERRSPPSGPGRGSPCSRANRRHRLTLAALTPKRSPASRCDAPASTAASTRTRRSSDSALDMPAGPQPRQTA